MLSQVLDLIDKRMGTVDLIYGMTDNQLRSATEANVKEQNTNIRPDDMASRVEDFLSEVAVNEAATAVWHCDGQHVQPCLGDLGAMVWDQNIKTQSFDRIVHDYDYRVAAGSARKPNKNTKQRALAELGQVILPTLQSFALQGVVEPWNAYIADVANAMDLDPAGYLLQANEQEGPSPEEQMAELEMQKMQLEMQIKQQEFVLKQQAAQEEAALKQQTTIAQEAMKQESERMKMMLESERMDQELEQDAELHDQELEQKRELSQQELMIERARLAMLTRENEIKLQGLQAMNRAKVQAARAQARASASAQKSSSSGE
jgi:hypothetical protein